MGAALFERYPDWTARADEILGYSVRTLCVDDPESKLGITTFTQPALFVVNALSYRARMDDGGQAPDVVAGHSLGEYNALVAAGVLDFESALGLVRLRGEIMGRVTGGGMSAVVGLEPAAIEGVLHGSEPGRRVDVANFNSFEQTVIAGPVEDLAAVKPDLAAAGARVIPLKVSAPFHSRYMREAQAEFARALDGVVFGEFGRPVIANVTGAPYVAAQARETLARQIGSCVRWLDTMCHLIDTGVDRFEEVGPGSVLTKLAAQIQKRHSTPAAADGAGA
jgi:trans-AT polyketide synthase/acyltransferase/oxidoreductase domain-containing protein